MTKISRHFDSYSYGPAGFLNDTTQPGSINVCAQYVDEQGEECFTEYSLLPSSVEGANIPVAAVGYGVWRIFAAFSKINQEPAGDIIHNAGVGLATIFSCGIFVKEVHHLLLHYTDEIRQDEQVLGKKEVGIIAIKGKVVAVFPLKQVDLMTSDTSNLTQEMRLQLLVSSVKKVLADSYIRNAESPFPVSDLLKSTYDTLNFIQTCKYDIAEIRKRISRLSDQQLGKAQCQELKLAIGEAATIINRFIAQKSPDPEEDLKGLEGEITSIKKCMKVILDQEDMLDKKLCRDLKEIAQTIQGIINRFLDKQSLKKPEPEESHQG